MKGSPEADLLLAYIKGSALENEKKEVENWLKENEEHEKELLQIARIYYSQRTHERIASRDPLPVLENIRRRVRQKKQNVWLRRIATTAACIAGIIVFSTFMSRPKEEIRETMSQHITIKSNPGMRTRFSLPDGTVVYLNSESSLTYPVPYDPKERRVSLTGEGFFNVVHNQDHPFTVSVLDSSLNVRVLGTEFNIQAYKEDNLIQATLLSGSISVEMNDNEGKTRNIKLLPSNRLTYDLSDKKIFIKQVNPIYDIAWIDGKLMFKDTPIPEVLSRLSHFYNVKFDVKDPVIESYRFTGTLQNRQLSQILDYIKISSNIDFRINQVTEDDSNGMKHTTITLWKKK